MPWRGRGTDRHETAETTRAQRERAADSTQEKRQAQEEREAAAEADRVRASGARAGKQWPGLSQWPSFSANLGLEKEHSRRVNNVWAG